jgi:subtilisin family serine protease
MSHWKTLRRWFRGPTQSARAGRAGRARLSLETLEGRIAPTASALSPVARAGGDFAVAGQTPAPPQAFSTDFRPIIELDAAQASYPYRGNGYSVAVLDTGIDYNNPDLGGGWGHRVIAGYNFVNNTSDPMDDNGHGTFIAGEIGSSSTTYPGVAPNINLIALKVLDSNAQGNWTNIDRALQWVISHQAQYHIVAVNLSLGSGNYTTNPNSLLESDFSTLKSQGVFISVAAGNNFYTFHSQPGLAYPAVSTNVVSVGATWAGTFGSVTFPGGETDYSTAPNQLAGFTQRDSALSILAPGAWITSDAVGGGFHQMGGTSMAAAVVTGAAAILHQALDAEGLSDHANEAYILQLMQSTGVVVRDTNTNANVTPTGLTFRQLDLKAALDAVPRPLVLAPIANVAIPSGGSAVVPLGATNPSGAPVTFSARIIDDPALAYQLDQQLGLTSSGNYYQNMDGYNEKWIQDRNGQWYAIMPNGEFRRWAGSMTATLQHANLVATLSAPYWADPGLLWNAAPAAFPPFTLSISGSQLTVRATARWTGSFPVEVTASDGTFYVIRVFTVTAQDTPPVLAAIADRSMAHSQHHLYVALSATDPDGDPITFSAQVLPSGGQTLPVSVSVQGSQLTVAPAIQFVGTFTVQATASDGALTATRTFHVTVTNSAPQPAAVAPQTMAPGQTSLTVALSATDADGDVVTFSAAALTPDAQAYQLDQQLHLAQYQGSYYTNTWGIGDKWLVGANNVWYGLLPDGRLYRWAGTLAQTLQPANLVATLNPIFYTEPRLLWDAQPPVAPPITATVQGNQLTLTRPAGLHGVFLIQVAANDGAATGTRTFLLRLN